ncbi:NAD(P)/FAD-dependent oxidoreductase [Candidatus Thorarchaeota archaeon]|nr:MAG: NAD(P)/FAD-dependent oxidoreductase [Candidatus Thorarchaeota archaeon]
MLVDTDVIIIGAGPAGLTAAKNLAKNNIEYILIDRDENPGEDKPCGGFIPASTLKVFSIPQIDGQYEIDSVRMKFPGKKLVRIPFENPLGVNVSRGELARALIQSIPDHDNKILFGTEVNRVETGSRSCTVSITSKGEFNSLTSKLVIDASGANPVSLRFIPIRERIPNTGMGYGLQYHIEMDGELDNSNTFLYGGKYSPSGYCWIFPRGHIIVVGTGGLVERVRKSDRKAHEYLDFVLEEVEPFSSELRGGRIVKKDSALMPLCGITKPSFGKRILLAGDAAGHCSPISGEGIHYSMVGGQKAATAAMQCIRKNDYTESMLARYEKQWISDIGSDLTWGLWLQRKLMRPGSERTSGWSSSGFIDSEKSQKIIAEMLAGRRSVRSAILAVAPSYLSSRLHRGKKKS